MENNDPKFLLVTANVGSLFEEYGEELRANWISAFHKLISENEPALIALHLQEVGGKSHDVSQDIVKNFFQDLYEPEYFDDYYSVQSFVDEEYVDVKYTAMGCSYFIHKSLKGHLQQWNFHEKRFVVAAEGREINQITSDTLFLQKYKFPLSCYSKNQTRLPRKGFTCSKWRLFNKVFVLLNIHLTHDACNIEITRQSPTKYSGYRRRSLEYMLDRLKTLQSDHQMMFGDFNVRPDTKALLEYLMDSKAVRHTLGAESEDAKPHTVIYRSCNGSTKDLLRIKERLFEFSDYEAFDGSHQTEILKFDKELDWLLNDKFAELPISFRPTYPHKENPKDIGTYSFANVRCPSWCDRILIDQELDNQLSKSTMVYDTFGEDVALGDHKPVFLALHFTSGLQANH
ncbi:inositol polyphosphate-5-phosphatase A-like isoform X1 [Clytia hemisphaerica]|uniref:inositol-polyphosphate 5-phosphatase n=1 Tax=Clytia hemisphaerica TaxID=252671 RepID=A0A7M5XIV6_9CNID|eukprot:TCONS_00070482-protein